MEKSWALNKLNKYLSIPTISAQGKGINETVKFLLSLFKEVGLKTKRIDCGGNPVVFAEHIAGDKAKTILFYNHYDVQPPEPLDKWISPPFKPTIRQGKLFARGTADNKGNLIARISAVKELLKENPRFPVNIKLLVEGEEEIGSPTLPKFVRKYRNLIKADLCIWESGSRDENDNPEITLGCKGICHMELFIRGAKTDLHSSKGVILPNPAWRLIWALASLKDENENILIDGFYKNVRAPRTIEKQVVRKIQFYESAKKKEFGITRFVNDLTGEKLKLRYFYQPALNINGLTSGYQGLGHKTVLPKQASVKIDFRLVPNQTPKEVITLLRRHLNKNGFSDIEIQNSRGYPPAQTQPDNPYVRLIEKVQGQVYRKKPVIEPLSAASGPMYLFSPLMPCASVGVGYPSANIHAPNENIRLDDFRLNIKCIREVIKVLETV
jgi:acetylornithine deacetylase/succinyl-diaminopimelate desuccinylase-like protein